MGAYVGRTAVKDGKGVMVDWHYADGKDYLPSDDAVKRLRPRGRLRPPAAVAPRRRRRGLESQHRRRRSARA